MLCQIRYAHGEKKNNKNTIMKTKTLLITAAAALAAGIMSSQAQVYSQNVVGYVNATIPANGYALLSNPLDTGNNVLTNLILVGGAPSTTTKADVWTGSGFTTYTLRAGGWSSGASGVLLNPGTGFFIQNLATTNITITFVGNVVAGTNLVPYTAGYDPVGSVTPISGLVQTTLGLPAVNGDKVLQWNPTSQGYITYTRRATGWGGGLEPTIGTNSFYGVAEGFFYQPVGSGNWTNVYNIQ
jgi:hypothetical protein